MNRFNKVIFVCMGNTCRSPMAATIMSNLMPDMRCESRGVVVLFPEPYNTLVLTMNSSMKQKMYDTFDKAINVFTLGEMAGEGDVEVPDPYGKGLEEYNKCFEQLYSLVAKVIDVITSPRQEEE